MSSTIVPDQRHQSSSRSSLGSDGAASPYAGREDSHFHRAKEDLQSMVKSHLKCLSREIGLGHGEFKEIARCSACTVLAACGLEQRRSEVYTIPPPSICSHRDRMATGQTSVMRGVCSNMFRCFHQRCNPKHNVHKTTTTLARFRSLQIDKHGLPLFACPSFFGDLDEK